MEIYFLFVCLFAFGFWGLFFLHIYTNVVNKKINLSALKDLTVFLIAYNSSSSETFATLYGVIKFPLLINELGNFDCGNYFRIIIDIENK